jgi:hypothetical protein
LPFPGPIIDGKKSVISPCIYAMICEDSYSYIFGN